MDRTLNMDDALRNKLEAYDTLRCEIISMLFEQNDITMQDVKEMDANNVDLIFEAYMQKCDEELEDDFEESLISHELHG